MNKLTIEIDRDTAEEIVVKELTYSYLMLYDDLIKRKSGTGMAIFEIDQKEDCKQIEKLLKSMHRVIEWYGSEEAIKALPLAS